MSLGTNECGFLFNATLGSLVHPTQLHCVFSNVVSNSKWLEWWVFHLLPGQCHPPVPRIHRASVPCDSHTAADLRKGWKSSQGFNCCLVGYSNLNILLRGHLKLALLFQKMLSHCSKSHWKSVWCVTWFHHILYFFPSLLVIYLSKPSYIPLLVFLITYIRSFLPFLFFLKYSGKA